MLTEFQKEIIDKICRDYKYPNEFMNIPNFKPGTANYKNKFGYSEWVRVNPTAKQSLTPIDKIQYVIQTVGMEAIPVKTKNWFQVYATKDGKPWMFGFAINEGIVEHFPVHQINGRPAEEARGWLRHQKPLPEVVKICEQIIK